MKNKKTKGSSWSPRYVGYMAHANRQRFYIIAGNMKMLREIHTMIFPDLPFRRKFCHPANIRRTGD